MATRRALFGTISCWRSATVGAATKTEAPRLLADFTKKTPVTQWTRSLATATTTTSDIIPDQSIPNLDSASSSTSAKPTFYEPAKSTLTTILKFPTLEPVALSSYPASLLLEPLRRDLLHRAIIFEADAARLGLARTKTRSEIHGSGAKLRPQKGTGKARLGDKSSPMLRGGAKAHGPKPRDFSTKLQRRVYDAAFRIALSYRFRRGDLCVVDELSEAPIPDAGYAAQLLAQNRWGRDHGNSLFVSLMPNEALYAALTELGGVQGRTLAVHDLDVKNLLEMGRVVIEKDALDWLLRHRAPKEERELMVD